ncbi:CHRD domain-containing protein [Patescibacteria group bacterium]|nr:CHRD domain-containing protein [Patescibacteria group bacterium]
MNKIGIIIPVILIVLIAGFLIFATQQNTSPEEESTTEVIPLVTPEKTIVKKELVIGLLEQNDSGESGTATLTEIGGQTRILIETAGATADISQPVHIHEGSCTELGGVNYPLTNITDGHSETTVEVSFEQLIEELPLAINIHKSGPEIDVYVACGDFPADLMMKEEGIMMEEEESIVVILLAQNDSGESGTATITKDNEEIKVVVSLNGAPSSAQPAHIHIGSCANLGGVEYPLNNVLNGSSETIIDVSLGQLLSELPLAVNVHKSSEELAVYIACGDITQ